MGQSTENAAGVGRATTHPPFSRRLLKAILTHGFIPAQAGIQVRGDQHTSSPGTAFSMDSGLRQNDTVGGFKFSETAVSP